VTRPSGGASILARRKTFAIEFWPDLGHNLLVSYRIALTENAMEDLKALDASRRARIRDALNIHLIHEPAKESRRRIKRLRDLSHPQYRLRVDDLRVFYDITENDVVVLSIMSKEKTDKWLKEHGEK
jgi:mRNA interferase RelE/StbE